MFGFKSKEEREKAKAEKEYSKMMQEIASSDEINEAVLKREAAERARAVQKDLDIQQKVIKAGGSLRNMESKARASLTIAINELKREEEKEYPNQVDIKRCKQRVKSYAFELLTIKRAQRSLEECKLNNQWDRAMGELSNTFKLMNEIRSGSTIIKKILFFFRYKRVEHMDKVVYNQASEYFGSKAKELPEDVIEKLKKTNPIDMVISDEIFNYLTDPSKIDSCMENPNIVTAPTDEVASYTVNLNEEMKSKGEEPVVKDVSKDSENKILTDEQINSLING